MRQREHPGGRAPNTPSTKRATSNPSEEGDDLDTPVGSFVRAMAVDLGVDGDTSANYRTRRQLLRLSSWAAGEGLTLDREVILDPSTVERFAEVALASDRSQATYRAVLRRVGPLLTRRAPWEPRPASLARRQVLADCRVGLRARIPRPGTAAAAVGWGFPHQGVIGFDFGRQFGRSEPWSPEPR